MWWMFFTHSAYYNLSLIDRVRDHLTDSEAVCFRSVFVFVKVMIVDYWGRLKGTHTLLLSKLRDLCVRWSLGGVFFWNKVHRLV